MIPAIAFWLVRRGLVRSEWARLAAMVLVAGAAVLAIAGGTALWLKIHDAGVIEHHETERQLGEAKASIDSEHRATANAAPRDQARAAAADQSAQAMKEAEDADPEAAKASAGPVSRAAARRFPVRD